MKLVLFAAGVFALFVAGLDHSPVYLAHDEVLNALNAHALATTAHDPNGRLLPLYIHIGGDYWAQPIVTYVTALVLLAFPLSEFAIRLPSVVVGVTSVVLIYAVARRLFERRLLAWIAAMLLATTPAHFLHSRLAVDHLYPVPFVLAWLWCLLAFLEHGRLRVLFAGGLVLGVGFYTYLASVVMMPVYVLLTLVTAVRAGRGGARATGVLLAGFLLPLLLLVPWLLAHPEQFGQQARMYSLYDPSRLNILQGARELASYTSLTARSEAFYDSFNPSILFFSGGSSLINGTRQAGVFLFPVALFLPVGLYHMVTRGLRPAWLILLLGFVSAPLAGSLVAEVAVNRMLVMLPFAVLIATLGVESLLSGGKRSRSVGVAALLVVPLQFAVFHRDYMGEYRVRSSVWFERNIRGALETMLEHDLRAVTPAVHLNLDEVPWVDAYWKFYVIKHGRESLWRRTIVFRGREVEPAGMPEGSLVLANAEGPMTDWLEASNALRRAYVIREPNDHPSFVVFVR
ncbi:MAG: ArnT family glycosyltransferase [Acidobacteriota bacterium]